MSKFWSKLKETLGSVVVFTLQPTTYYIKISPMQLIIKSLIKLA